MAIVNFHVPEPLEKQIKRTIKQKGFSSKAEFFRFAALYTLGNLGAPKTLDEIISESRADYQAGSYKSFKSAKSLLKELKD